MSEGQKKEYKLPEPDFPSMDMPTPPNAGSPEDGIRIDCSGNSTEAPVSNVGVPDPIPGIPRIMIGIPVLLFSYDFVISFLKFWTQLCLQTQGRMQIGYQFIYRKPVHMAEIELVEIAKFNKCTHVLLMDDDIFDVTIDDLNKLLNADKDVIGGVMYTSKFPYAMCVFRRYNKDKKVIDMPSDNSMYRLYEIPCLCSSCGIGLSHWDAKFCPVCGAAQDNLIQKADLIPFAFTLIKMSVFDKIKKPWFHCEKEYPTDSWFADRCREAGIQEYAHMGVRLNHNGINDLTRSFMHQMELEKQRAKKVNGIVLMTPEDMEKHQYLLHQKMQEAEARVKPRLELVEGQIREVLNDSQDSNLKKAVP